MTFDPAKRDFLQRWAAEEKCHLEDRGEVGFGRPCVGIVHGSAYVDLPLYGSDDYDRQWAALPTSPPNAYHKSDCLCVLVQTENWDNIPDADYDAALEELFTWVTALNDGNWHVRIQDRETYNKDGIGKVFELLMGGISQAVLVKEFD